jgi:hypothetical protein
MTLGSAAKAHLTLVVWCKDCRHQAEPDLAAMVERRGITDGRCRRGAGMVAGRFSSDGLNPARLMNG